MIALKLCALLSSLVSFFICLLQNSSVTRALTFICILPAVFFIGFIFFEYSYKKSKKRNSLTVNLVILFSFLCCVVMPALGVVSGYYKSKGVLITTKSMETALTLIIIEHVAIWLVLLFINHKPTNLNHSNHDLKKYSFILSGNKYVYWVFCFFAATLYLTAGRKLDLFSFFFIDAGIDRIGDIKDSSTVLMQTIVSAAITFLVLILINDCYKKYVHNKKIKYVNMAILVACLRIGIIVGERRSEQVYLLFAFIFILPKLFPEHKRKIIKLCVSAAAIVLISMSIYKFFNAFLYGSYFEAVKSNTLDVKGIAELLDSYFYGIFTTTKNVDFVRNSNLSIENFLYDLGRNIFGLHYLFKGDGNTVTEMYNLYIYSGAAKNGYLFSSVGYGYAFLGTILAPAFTCLNILFCNYLEKFLKRSYSIELLYIFSIVYMRLIFGMFSAYPPQLNYITRIIVIYGLIILCGVILNKKRKRKYDEKNII